MRFLDGRFRWSTHISVLAGLVVLFAYAIPAGAAAPEVQLVAQKMGQGGMMQGQGQGMMMNRGGTTPMQPGAMMQRRMMMMNQMMQMRMRMQKQLEEKLKAAEQSSGQARVDAMLDLLRTMVQQRGQMMQHMQGMHEQMQGMRMMMRGRHMMNRGEMMMGPGMMGPGMGSGMQQRQRQHQPPSDGR